MDDVEDHGVLATSFGAAARAYQRGRPSYPVGAVDWLVPAGARQVLDLGAGTGKLSAVLAERGMDVVAVDPSPAMLDQLRQAVPGARALAGAAEDIPLPDACVDAVVLADAWQWVDPVRALPEIARVLRAGGTLGLVWNLRQDAGGWSAALRELLESHTTSAGGSLDLDELGIGEPFAPLESCEVPWSQHLARQQVVDITASRSDVILLPAPAREELVTQVRDLLDTHPDLTGSGDVAMAYTARCYRTRLR